MYLIILRDEQPSSFAYTTIKRVLSRELSNMKEESRMHVPSVIYQLRQNTKLFKMELVHTFVTMNAKQIADAQREWENHFPTVDNPNEVEEEDIDSVAPDTSKVEEKDIVAPSKASKKGTGEKKNKKGQRKHSKSVAPNKAEQTNTQEKDIVAPSKASKKGTGEKKKKNGQRKHSKSVAPNKAEQTNTQSPPLRRSPRRPGKKSRMSEQILPTKKLF